MALRVALFELGGVLLGPSPREVFSRTEEALALPSGFFGKVTTQGGQEGPFARLLRGELTLGQAVPLLDEACRDNSAASGFRLPTPFSIRRVFDEMRSGAEINIPMLQAAIALRNRGWKTCILSNTWVDDSPERSQQAQISCALAKHFDLRVESCRVGVAKPDPAIYLLALEALGARPHEAVCLDDTEANLRAALELGLVTIQAQNTAAALEKLEQITGMQPLGPKETLLTACRPDSVAHGQVSVKPGVQLHFVEAGTGPAVCLCHGFPESWFSWRYQIPALADAGFRVIALDMKGYGDSSAPQAMEEYSQEEMCKEAVTFLDKLGISQAVFIGHDWGGMFVWNMALFYPERVRAVASLNTPFMPADPSVPTMEKIRAMPVFDYQLYFQEPGVAEAELEADLSRTLKLLIRASDEKNFVTTCEVQKRGGLLVGMPESPPTSRILKEEDLRVYVQQFEKSGFRGPLNWYRNVERNWRWSCIAAGRKIMVPALMITAGKDPVLTPHMSRNMEEWVPQLKRSHIEECGHWTQMDRPTELNQILTKWLKQLPASVAKL
ncbi:bifunctional epoxide hydrolase 2 isoform X1 [Tachyglossus aculeatus]|uniref:bifunctional epoxide hydrolase 2 isoform X1 n=1 Tax=Tachyglossus aculeatus TaxID=9261 RepID=UPI0018F69AE1|nr:bifunctional epoxide hydrolase 2 isoform X1 [Tachyglossus aculeatus]